ncbi:MAG: tRNA (adenosine(37)-N6)-dimethylallyltransferase MiaA [Peptoniphilus sp.]|nr:tRNA (adenosine(37)-N6)-dimethylallyltransferase MiaA [Peptoniphilus sp.]MDD7362999.1 tRNA (adenosine(37)-N6)-dimethylallyltransferase MiaA [Bacillota bacterium]MDY6044239.1 tRNA (adenosine(37)-N6)-dimethylallyltransferase MiaA [Peptoniphilus sp.]
MRRLILITGPTGSGKSDLSVRLAKKLNTEVISADSVQVYRGFDIGSGKVTAEDMRGVRHHLIDTKDPTEFYSAADFYEEAMPIVDELNRAGKIPIICGGTALYIHGLIYNLDFTNKPSMALRRKLNARYEEEGLESLVRLLEEKNPELAEKTALDNPRRVIRAIERLESGKVETETLRQKRKDVDPLYFILNWERETLYDRINRRVLKMVDEGLFEEVTSLYDTYGGDIKPMSAIGYKEIVRYLRGEWEKETAIEKIQQHTRNFAKRQQTWFKKEEDGIPVDMNAHSEEDAVDIILEIVRKHYE